jgi:hypothetical protein
MKSPALFLLACFALILPRAGAANYPLEIIQPQPGLDTKSRYYKAYPGVPYRVPIGVLGGALPFAYSLTSAPPGMTIHHGTGVVSWPSPSPAGSPHSVTVKVVDAEGAEAAVSWTIAVTTEGFLFVDAKNGRHARGFGATPDGAGDGSMANPFRSMNDIYQNDPANPESWRNSAFADHFIYWRAGTYALEGNIDVSPDPLLRLLEWRGNSKPHVWLAYPGETVIFDHMQGPDANGAGFDFRDGNADDFYIQGITFRNMRNHAIRTTRSRLVFFENAFENLGPGRDGYNSSFIMFTGRDLGSSHHVFVRDNVFRKGDTTAFVKAYGLTRSVFEGNTFADPSGDTEGLALKHANRHVDVRNNLFDGRFTTGAISGNWNDDGDLEIRFNHVKNAANTYVRHSLDGAITINHDKLARFPVHIYRNTFEGNVIVRFAASDNGPFHIHHNVIINENAEPTPGSGLSFQDVEDPSRVVLSDNLSATPSQGMTDAHGNLTAAFSRFRATHGHQAAKGESK